MSEKTLVEIESEKPALGNFTMSEYTEKVIQYGLMMVRYHKNPKFSDTQIVCCNYPRI